MKYLVFFPLTLLILFTSCKKEEEPVINPCANGVKDPGEDEIDCGGTCSACYHYPYLIFKCNEEDIQANDKDLVYDGTRYLLQASFDSIQFQLNFGTTGSIGTYYFTPENMSCIGGQLPYTFVSGIYSINANNTAEKYMSGNFEVKFARGFNDTIKFEGGQFEYLSY